MSIGNGSRVYIGAAATIIACLIAAVIALIATRGRVVSEPRSGEMSVEHWERQFTQVKQEVDSNEVLLRIIESHAQLQTSYMQSQNELLREIRNELRRIRRQD